MLLPLFLDASKKMHLTVSEACRRQRNNRIINPDHQQKHIGILHAAKVVAATLPLPPPVTTSTTTTTMLIIVVIQRRRRPCPILGPIRAIVPKRGKKFRSNRPSKGRGTKRSCSRRGRPHCTRRSSWTSRPGKGGCGIRWDRWVSVSCRERKILFRNKRPNCRNN